ncbi:MAG: 5-formyltetrahydrofolate cyclo-ligase [Candidatus Micrarchaeota archaeon]
MNKAELRKVLKETLSKQPISERERKSKLVINELIGLKEYSKAKTILIYVSMKEEVSTIEFITNAIVEGKCVVVPAVDKSGKSMTLHKINSLGDLEPGYKGIHEPRDKSCEVPSESIDLAVVPGLAFDSRGNRLGRGKGMFDKLFEKAKCPKIALAFDFQVVETVPVEGHDFPVEIIVTEKRVLRLIR